MTSEDKNICRAENSREKKTQIKQRQKMYYKNGGEDEWIHVELIETQRRVTKHRKLYKVYGI